MKNGLPISYLPDNSDFWFWPPLMVNKYNFVIYILGIMDHEEARKRKTGGKILGFFYWNLIL